MRNALPHASYIGFTGTPLSRATKLRGACSAVTSPPTTSSAPSRTKPRCRSTTTRAVTKLGVAIGDLNERIAQKLEELETEITADIDVEQRLENELKRDYHIITADKRAVIPLFSSVAGVWG